MYRVGEFRKMLTQKYFTIGFFLEISFCKFIGALRALMNLAAYDFFHIFSYNLLFFFFTIHMCIYLQ